MRALDSLVQKAVAEATPPAKIEPLPAIDCATAIPGSTTSYEPLSADAGAVAVAADRLARPTRCAFSVDGVKWHGATVYPRSTVRYDACAAEDGGTVVEVPGATGAYVPNPQPFGNLGLCTTDGTSSVTIDGPELGSPTAWPDDLLAKAGELAAALLAVASG
jgi:hypothetical protein